jgi:hypothetical protein
MMSLTGVSVSKTLTRILSVFSILVLVGACLPTCSTGSQQNINDGAMDTVILFGTGSGVGNPGGVSISFDNLQTVTTNAPVVWDNILLQTEVVSFVTTSSARTKDNDDDGGDDCNGDKLTFALPEAQQFSFIEHNRTRLEGTIDDPRRFCEMIFESTESALDTKILIHGRRGSDGAPIEVQLVFSKGLRLKQLNEAFQFPANMQKLWILLIEPDELLDKVDVEDWEPNEHGVIVIDEETWKKDARRIAKNLSKRVRLLEDSDGNGRLTPGEEEHVVGEFEVEDEKNGNGGDDG